MLFSLMIQFVNQLENWITHFPLPESAISSSTSHVISEPPPMSPIVATMFKFLSAILTRGAWLADAIVTERLFFRYWMVSIGSVAGSGTPEAPTTWNTPSSHCENCSAAGPNGVLSIVSLRPTPNRDWVIGYDGI